MIRTALQPRWLALSAVLVVVVFAFGRLGWWQFSVAQESEAREYLQAQQARPVVQLEDYLAPHRPFPQDGSNRMVQAQGEYAGAQQFLVPRRYLGGQEGYWVITPLRTGAGALLPVLRGWVAEPAQADTPAATSLTVTGTLAPGESPAQAADLPEGQLGSVDLAVLANTWEDPLYNAFVFATQERPALSAGTVTPVPPPALRGSGSDWRNVGYALQWWVFAGFAGYMYLRFLKDAAAERHTVPS